MSYTIKQLASLDLDLMKQLLKVYGEAFGDMSTYQDKVPSDEYLQNLLVKDSFITVVALNETEVVGGLSAYVLQKFEQERKEIYIYDLAVAESYRRQGIATDCINKLKEIAKNIGAYVIYVQADPPDLPAVRLYESLGTKEEVFHFDIIP